MVQTENTDAAQEKLESDVMLPNLPNNIEHRPVQTLAFLGLNLTPATQDGEFADTLGLSTTDYPFLTQIVERTSQTGYTSPTDIYIWDGHLYVVDGTDLKKDGTVIGTVTAGQKQMAVINTKLVIFPDKVYVDMTDDTVHSLVAKNETYATYTITDKSIQATGIAAAFADGDVVDVTGTGIEGKRIVVQEVDPDTDTITFIDGAITLGTYSGNITVKSSTPELDFICSSNNRIWGVCNEDNTVYASALGDPTTFFDYTGESGSYSLAIGSEGDFTGICNYGGSVLVWKEDILHKIMGNYPSEYYMVDYPVYGVQKGSEKSLVVINNVLYYKGVFGVYQYGGNTPVNISANLGNDIYKNAVAGTDGRKYYINMQDAAGDYHLYAYDLLHGLWMKEENGQMPAITNLDQDLFFVKGGVLYRTGSSVDPALEWMCEFVEKTENTFDRKGYLKIHVRLDMTAGSSLKIYAKEDRRSYREIYSKTAGNDVTLLVPIRLGRCDRWQVKFEGVGEVVIRAVGREYVEGSVK